MFTRYGVELLKFLARMSRKYSGEMVEASLSVLGVLVDY